ncbi:MAG: Ig-like domain-containing protein [Methanosarcina sp.]|nr:Ig-like domain-containing protein [Methanosarcina sp.]
MKQRLILFSALLIMFLSVGAASATDDNLSVNETLSVNITCSGSSGTGYFKPGDTVNITADFNKNVTNATISITKGSPRTVVGTPNVNLVGAGLPTNVPMNPISGPNDMGGNSFSYEFPMPEDIIAALLGINISALDIDGVPVDNGDDGSFSYPDAFNLDPSIDFQKPRFISVKPESEFINKNCVLFNFSASDDTSDEVTYTFSLDGVVKSSGVIASGVYKQFEFELADGKHTWEVKLRDEAGNIGESGLRNLYVDTKCPTVKLISPADCYKEIIGPTDFRFVCEDASAAEYDLDLTYALYIDGKPAAIYTDIPGYTPGYDYEDGYEQIPWDDIFPDGIDWEELFPGMPWEELVFPGIPVNEIPNNGIPEDGIPEDFWDDLFPEDVISGDVKSGEPVSKKLSLADGAHNWSVSVEDGAGNKVISEVRDFYVSLDGLKVTLVSPNGGFVTSNPTFIFTVEGKNGEGAGLPFHYKLIIDGKEVNAKCDEKETKVCCAAGDCCEDGFVVGEDNYSITTAVPDGVNKNWTVIITDCTSDKIFKPAGQPLRFSVDSECPAPVANLCVEDAPGYTDWTSTKDYPGLMVSWNASTEEDLANMPYEVYISTFKPGCIEDMQRVITDGSENHTDGTDTPNQILEDSEDTDLCIEAINGKDLVYGKDYWVAVIARDRAGNYDECFAMCGPVQTYEDMNITLDEGWNLKSVPKRLVASKACPESVFGEDSIVIYWDGSCWQFPDTIEPCKGYWVYTEEPCMTNIKFKGMSVDGANPDVPASLVLKPGWQMIGHTSTYAVEWPTTLASLTNVLDCKFSSLITYSQNEGWGGIIPDVNLLSKVSTVGQSDNETVPEPVFTLQSYEYMVPGQGYWIFMKNEGTYASIENTYNLDLMVNDQN